MIKVNQLGYRPRDYKKAVVSSESTRFQVLTTPGEEVVFEAPVSEVRISEATQDAVRIADFSELTVAGLYKIRTEVGDSDSFVIREDAYRSVRTSVLEFFPAQACGVEVKAGLWSHEACHTTPAYVINEEGQETGEIIDVSGGWHDAGDYGRYPTPAAMAVSQLLWAHELSPNSRDEDLIYTWFEIEWMLKMQEPISGGVYHKASCHTFCALDIMPNEEKEKIIVSPISLTATANSAAVWAMASRLYPEHKEKLLSAALKAWAFCKNNEQMSGFKNPPGILTGEYGDSHTSDELFWLASELYIATKDSTFLGAMKRYQPSLGFGWREVGSFGIIAYLEHSKDESDTSFYQECLSLFLNEAKRLNEVYLTEPYGVSLGAEYTWGSNLAVGNNAMTLLLASRYTDTLTSAQYIKAATDHMHYILGCNALYTSFISGFGRHPMAHPHHRPSVAVNAAMPGMVSGGPNGTTSADPALREVNKELPPAKCWVDHDDSYSSNEVTVYWNSSIYFVMAYLGY